MLVRKADLPGFRAERRRTSTPTSTAPRSTSPISRSRARRVARLRPAVPDRRIVHRARTCTSSATPTLPGAADTSAAGRQCVRDDASRRQFARAGRATRRRCVDRVPEARRHGTGDFDPRSRAHDPQERSFALHGLHRSCSTRGACRRCRSGRRRAAARAAEIALARIVATAHGERRCAARPGRAGAARVVPNIPPMPLRDTAGRGRRGKREPGGSVTTSRGEHQPSRPPSPIALVRVPLPRDRGVELRHVPRRDRAHRRRLRPRPAPASGSPRSSSPTSCRSSSSGSCSARSSTGSRAAGS